MCTRFGQLVRQRNSFMLKFSHLLNHTTQVLRISPDLGKHYYARGLLMSPAHRFACVCIQQVGCSIGFHCDPLVEPTWSHAYTPNSLASFLVFFWRSPLSSYTHTCAAEC